MAWDFSTDPQFQRKLDWVERFCQEKVEPLDYVFPHAVRWRDPAVKAYVRELQQEVKDQGLWAIFLDRELGGPGFGQLSPLEPALPERPGCGIWNDGEPGWIRARRQPRLR